MPIATDGVWTVEDVWALPDDPHHRYEVVDGELLVSPSPSIVHQRAVVELLLPLHAFTRALGTFEAIIAPSDVVVHDRHLVQPDVYVVPRVPPELLRAGARELPLPLLAIEVLSPSTARADRWTKRRLYQRGVIEYWIVDLYARLIERWTPDAERPEICVESVSWQPTGPTNAFVLDIGAFMTAVCGDT